MDEIKAGRPTIELIKLCYGANRPLLLAGRHGIGKSELLEGAAKDIGIGFICRDLSVMEPPDLIGLPKMNGKKTTYLPPDFLPTDGGGLLVFEELNRCERFMRAPCLQLLTSRTLNDYRLPTGWLPVAAINPSDSEEEYEVSELDPALLSRFVQVRLVPDRKEWIEWARRSDVHEAVIRYVQSDSSVFDSSESSPRSWKYVSDVLLEAERSGAPSETLRAAIMGLVGLERGVAFLRTVKTKEISLSAVDVLESYDTCRKKLQRWVKNGRIDLVESSLRSVLTDLQPKANYEEVRADDSRYKNLASFLADLPGDLQDKAKKDFQSRKRDYPTRTTRRKK